MWIVDAHKKPLYLCSHDMDVFICQEPHVSVHLIKNNGCIGWYNVAECKSQQSRKGVTRSNILTVLCWYALAWRSTLKVQKNFEIQKPKLPLFRFKHNQLRLQNYLSEKRCCRFFTTLSLTCKVHQLHSFTCLSIFGIVQYITILHALIFSYFDLFLNYS